ncbi:MAG: hypothetical protein K2X66_05580, partial [Cyanobacteria bacterium]|nr:hypothetical protein [Cyanobacteriota bacterium]
MNVRPSLPKFGATLTIRPEANLSKEAYETTALLAGAKKDNLTKLDAIQDSVDPLKMEITVNAEGPSATIKTRANGSLNLNYDPAEGPVNFLLRLLTQADLKAKSLVDPQARAAKLIKSLTTDVYSGIGYFASGSGVRGNTTFSPFIYSDIDLGSVTFRFQKFDRGNNSFSYTIKKLDDAGNPDPDYHITMETEGVGANRWVQSLEFKRETEEGVGHRMGLDRIWSKGQPSQYVFSPYYGGNENGKNETLVPAMSKLISGMFTLITTIEAENPA